MTQYINQNFGLNKKKWRKYQVSFYNYLDMFPLLSLCFHWIKKEIIDFEIVAIFDWCTVCKYLIVYMSFNDDKIRLYSVIDRLVSLVFRIHWRLMHNYMHRTLNCEGRAYRGCIHDDKKCERRERGKERVGGRGQGRGDRRKKDGQSLARYKFRHLPQ